jgi:hypothetical protein
MRPVTSVTGTALVTCALWAGLWLLVPFLSFLLLFTPPFLPFFTFASKWVPDINRKEILHNI